MKRVEHVTQSDVGIANLSVSLVRLLERPNLSEDQVINTTGQMMFSWFAGQGVPSSPELLEGWGEEAKLDPDEQHQLDKINGT